MVVARRTSPIRRPRKRWAHSLLTALLVTVSLPSAHADDAAEIALEKANALEQRVADAEEVTPAKADARLTLTGVLAVDPNGAAPLEDAISCLARSVYWEAKGTNREEMEAVANVIMNRLSNTLFPSTLCDVVQQGSESGHCQFSWWCDGRPDDASELDEYALALDVARQALNGTLPDHTRGALFFHDRSISPGWFSELPMTTQTQEFRFYRLPG
ncbi:cell wall hydrolase [Salinicola aestuarinus]|uniref:cell wall hydrolase n=1 Tax=Salinicola aestuarinus TaxID=1949082 RepID=UPI000DA22B7E|nr:cell wall hydrolase [Salinicola aestuarinus]